MLFKTCRATPTDKALLDFSLMKLIPDLMRSFCAKLMEVLLANLKELVVLSLPLMAKRLQILKTFILVIYL